MTFDNILISIVGLNYIPAVELKMCDLLAPRHTRKSLIKLLVQYFNIFTDILMSDAVNCCSFLSNMATGCNMLFVHCTEVHCIVSV